MRSNKNRATRFLLRRNLFIGVTVFLVAFYMLPFWALSHIPSEKAFAEEFVNPHSMTTRFTNLVSADVLTGQLNLELMVVIFGGLGFLTAIMLMSHQFSRRQSMLYAALPDRRETDFLRRCAGYAVLCLAPIVINFLLYLLVVAVNGMTQYVAWGTLLPKFGMLLLINFYGFAMGLLCSVLTGTYWAALLAGGVLIVGAEALAALWYWLSCRYLHTLVRDSFMDALTRLSPAYTLYKGFYKPDAFSCLPGVVAIVLALALSFVLYRVRKTERAERTLAFEGLHTVLGVALPLLGGTFLGIVVKLSFETEISLVAGMAVGAFLTFWVCRMVFNQRFCGIGRQWRIPVASTALLMLGVVLLHTDMMGYDNYLPAREELTAISYQPRGYHTDERIMLTSEEALDAAYEWCNLMRNEVDGYGDGLMPGPATFNDGHVVVTYHMGDREVHRHYPNHEMRGDAQDSLRRMMESDDYRQSLIAESHLDTGDVTTLYMNGERIMMNQDAFIERFGVPLLYRGLQREENGRKLDELLSALKADILDRTLAEKQEDPIMSVGLSINPAGVGSSIYRTLNIYPGDTNVLNAIFGENTEAVIEYVTAGFAKSEDIAVLRVDYAMTRREIRESGVSLQEAAQSVTAAASAEEAMEWLRQSQELSADSYYYMPSLEDAPYTRLYVYQLSEVAQYSGVYGYEVPEDLTALYDGQNIPARMVLSYIGEN